MQQDTAVTHYEVLGVSEDTTTQDIEKAYRTLIRDLHPDGKPEAHREKFTEMASQANHARDVLTDEDERRKYDLILKQAREWAHSEEDEEGDFVVDEDEDGAYEPPPGSGYDTDGTTQAEPRTEAQPEPAPPFMARVENVLESFPPLVNALLATLLGSIAWTVAILATTALDALVVGIILVLIVPLLAAPVWYAASKLRRIRDRIAHGAGMATQLVMVEQLRKNPITASVVDFAVSAEEKIGVPVTITHRTARAIALGPVMTLVGAAIGSIYGWAVIAAIAWAVAWIALIAMRWRRGKDPL